MRKILELGIISFGLLLMAAYSTHACSCYAKAPVCEAYGGSSAVFVGKVIEGKSVERMSEMFQAGTEDLTFKFAVSRAFVGAKEGETITIHTGFGFGDCGFPFELGEEYIVYAYETKGKLKTGICSRTTHVSRASEDLEGLKSVLRNTGAKVSGLVTRYERSSLIGEPFLPVARQKIRLIRSGDSKAFETETTSEGRYEFFKLPAGRYTIESPLEPGWKLDDYETDEFLLNEHGCATQNLSIENGVRATVTILDPDGKPVKTAWVEWVPVGVATIINRSPRELGLTDGDGEAVEFDLPPGKYTVSVNLFHAPDKNAPFPTTFAPGVLDRSAAQVVEIKPGSKISDIVIRVPKRLEQASISGTVLWPDGKPAIGVDVGLTDIEGDDVCVNECSETNAQGKFQLSGYPGREYKIWVRSEKTVSDEEIVYRVESGVFTITTNLSPFRLMMRRSKN